MPARFIRPPLLPKTQKGTIPFQPPAAATAEREADQISDGLLVIRSVKPKFSTNLISVFFSFGPSTARFLFFSAEKKRKWGVEVGPAVRKQLTIAPQRKLRPPKSHYFLVMYYQKKLKNIFENKYHYCQQRYPKRCVQPNGQPRRRHNNPLQKVAG